MPRRLAPRGPSKEWRTGASRAGGTAAAFFGLTLATGTLVVMGSAGVGPVVGNLATGRDCDAHLLATVPIIGVFHSILKAANDRIPSRRTTLDPTDTRDPGKPSRIARRREVPTRRWCSTIPGPLRPTDFVLNGDKFEARLIDEQTGAQYGEAEIETDAKADPRPGRG